MSTLAAETNSGTEPPLHRTGRFPCFDGLRAIAAIGVLVYHVCINYNLRTLRTDTWAWVSRLGTFGVAVFFLISGFLLYRPYVTAAFADRPVPELVPFWFRRFFRIFPAYWLALVGLIFIFGFMDVRSGSGYLTLFGLLQNYRTGYPLYGIGIEWTLVIEVSFYIALPGVAWMLRSIPRPDALPLAKLRIQLGGLATMYIAALLVRYWRLWIFDAGRQVRGGWFPIAQVNYWLIGYADWFALGMLLAVASAWVSRGGRLPWIVEWFGRRPWASWLLAAELFWVGTAFNAPSNVFFAAATRLQGFGISFVFGLVAFFLLLPAVVGDQDRGLIRAALRNPVLVGLGTVSYGIYLWHLIWLRQVKQWTNQGSLSGGLWTWLIVTFVLTVATACISYFLVERPLIRLSRRGGRQRPQALATSPSR